jgi:EAL domain-containing protein (putative c-di-GMP-specific phosphodiesterase class I)/GGDEF domain-containing protein
MEIANLAAISDEFGARIAELAVQAISNRLLQARKPGVFLARTAEARYCGVGIVTDRQEMLLRATRLQASLSQDLLIEGTEIAVDVRVGGVVFPDDAADAELLFGKTQAVLARAVADPLHPVTVPDEAAEACARRKLAIATALRGALDRGEFELHYQPQVRIADGVVIGYEALLRWHHPVLGTVPPAEFIPAAEDNGRILPIGAWILLTACQEAITWPAGMRVAVNMSALQLRQSDMPQQVAEALAASGLAPDRLEIELTESLLMEDRAAAHGVLRQIKALGARLALDDFGTGYSSMDVLRIGLFDKIKLDKSFVADIETAPQARAILHAMLALGRELAMPMLAEGVETEEQLAILRREGCVTVQGYLTGRPVPASALGGG